MSDSHHHLMRSGSEEPTTSNTTRETVQGLSSTANSSAFSNGVIGDVEHTSELLDQFGRLLLSDDCSDITLIVEENRLPAHRIILSVRSHYFRAMLVSGMRESTETEVTLVDTPLQAFKVLLKYIYCGRMQLHSMNFDLVIEVLGLVHKYGFTELEGEVAEYLKSTLNSRNACVIYATSHLYSMNGVIAACLDFIDNYAAEILSTQGFLQLSSLCVRQLISRNSFCAPEIDIFNAIARWIETHPEESDSFESVLGHIRLSLIKLDDLLNVVRPTQLLDSDKLLDAINEQNKKRSSDLVYRGILCPMMNVAEPAMNAKVLTGEFPTALLLSKKGYSKDHERKFTRHAINAHDPGIIIELGRSFIINHIRLWLLDRDQGNQTFSYYIEVSMDRNDWVRVIDHTAYLCKSFQNLFFHERVVKFVRIVGTHNSLHGTFNLVSFEALYTTEPFAIDPTTTLLIPHSNVATIQPGYASVIEGVSRSRNALLDGEIHNYDWDDGLLLWDCDDRTYSFYIEVSCDQTKWTKIVDVTNRRSWQTIRFQRIPVVFIKIVGTANSANEVFQYVIRGAYPCATLPKKTPATNLTDVDRPSFLSQLSDSTSVENNFPTPSNLQLNSRSREQNLLSRVDEEIEPVGEALIQDGENFLQLMPAIQEMDEDAQQDVEAFAD